MGRQVRLGEFIEGLLFGPGQILAFPDLLKSLGQQQFGVLAVAVRDFPMPLTVLIPVIEHPLAAPLCNTGHRYLLRIRTSLYRGDELTASIDRRQQFTPE